jgi:hypothetical protein
MVAWSHWMLLVTAAWLVECLLLLNRIGFPEDRNVFPFQE